MDSQPEMLPLSRRIETTAATSAHCALTISPCGRGASHAYLLEERKLANPACVVAPPPMPV